jgi:hypothetical protein
VSARERSGDTGHRHIGSRIAADFTANFAVNLNLALRSYVQTGCASQGSADRRAAQQLAAAHNEKAVNTQYLAFLSRRCDIYKTQEAARV